MIVAAALLCIALSPADAARDFAAESDALLFSRTPLLRGVEELRQRFDHERDPTRRAEWAQFLAMFLSFEGDYAAARTAYDESRDDESPPRPLPPSYRTLRAVDAVADAARDKDVVFINESHGDVRTRVLSFRLLRRLRALGFSRLALETLAIPEHAREPTHGALLSDHALARRGAPLDSVETGVYTREPVYAELVREALRVGYDVTGYDDYYQASEAAREMAGAANLRRILREKRTRTIVLVGFSHASRRPDRLAGMIASDRGYRVLTVDQTQMLSRVDAARDSAVYSSVIRATADEPVIVVDSGGAPWSAAPEDFDISVFIPRDEGPDRPAWLALGGARRPVPIAGTVCRDRFPCLVEARRRDEAAGAVPADRLVLRDPARKTLYLAPGAYRVTARALDDTLIAAASLVVSARGE